MLNTAKHSLVVLFLLTQTLSSYQAGAYAQKISKNLFESKSFKTTTAINSSSSQLKLYKNPEVAAYDNNDAKNSKSKYDTKYSTVSSSSLYSVSSISGGFLPSYPGLGAGLMQPLVSALGFMVWDNNWHGSSFALNMVKNTFATIMFICTLTIGKGLMNPFSEVIPLRLMACSSLFGVVLGDCAAIAALRLLGSRKFLLVHCLKPVISCIVGVFVFGEQLSRRAMAGILSIMIGVYVASSSKVQNLKATEDDESKDKNDEKRIVRGYIYALSHLLMENIGVTLTKTCMRDIPILTPLYVGFLRYGSGAFMLFLISLFGPLINATASLVIKNEATDVSKWWVLPKTSNKHKVVISNTDNTGEVNTMTKSNWIAIAYGTFFVTFLGPTFFYRSLKFLNLGITVTLSCTAPLFEPILARVMHGTSINKRAILGSSFAVLGVTALCM